MDIRVLDAVARRLPAGRLSRRGALRRVGASGLAAGVLATLGARPGQGQEWETATPTARAAPPAAPDPPLFRRQRWSAAIRISPRGEPTAPVPGW